MIRFGFDVRRPRYEGARCREVLWRGEAPAQGGPLLVFLHGMGECGKDGEAHLRVGLGPALAAGRFAWPGVVFLPQKPERYVEWSAYAEELEAGVDATLAEFDLDPRRVSLAGMSQGGAGVLDLACRNPERYSAIAAVCPYVAEPAVGWRELKDMEAWLAEPRAERIAELVAALGKTPLQLFHGLQDDAVPAEFSRDLARAWRTAGLPIGLELYPDLGHAAWDRAFAHPRLPGFLANPPRENPS